LPTAQALLAKVLSVCSGSAVGPPPWGRLHDGGPPPDSNLKCNIGVLVQA